MPELAPKPIILIVENEPPILNDLAAKAEEARLEHYECRFKEEAIEKIDELMKVENTRSRFRALIADLNLSGADGEYSGWDVIQHAYAALKSLDLIIYSGNFFKSNIPYKVYLDIPALTLIDKKSTKSEQKVVDRFTAVRNKWDNARQLALDEDTKIIYDDLATTYAKSALPILILGETGTGKERLAKEIAAKAKNELSPSISNERLVVSVNCGALEPSLAFSELFGHTRDAFTDAAVHKLGKFLEASGYLEGSDQEGKGKNRSYMEWLEEKNGPFTADESGLLVSEKAEARAKTLFLDEVAALPRTVMPGLLRVLETRDIVPLGYQGRPIKTYCRIISATNEVLDSAKFSVRSGALVGQAEVG
jgi:DNA-binding NtrC family response regulator